LSITDWTEQLQRSWISESTTFNGHEFVSPKFTPLVCRFIIISLYALGVAISEA